MSEILSTLLTARGLGFQDYKPPVQDSPNFKELYGENPESMNNGGSDEFAFAADPALIGTEIASIPVIDSWGKDKDIFLKTGQTTFYTPATSMVDLWEGMSIFMAVVNSTLTYLVDFYAKTWTVRDVGAMKAATAGSGSVYDTAIFPNVIAKSDQYILVGIENYSGQTMGSGNAILYLIGVLVDTTVSS